MNGVTFSSVGLCGRRELVRALQSEDREVAFLAHAFLAKRPLALLKQIDSEDDPRYPRVRPQVF
jgi:hypothetical protein